MWTCNLHKIEQYHAHQHLADHTSLAFIIQRNDTCTDQSVQKLVYLHDKCGPASYHCLILPPITWEINSSTWNEKDWTICCLFPILASTHQPCISTSAPMAYFWAPL